MSAQSVETRIAIMADGQRSIIVGRLCRPENMAVEMPIALARSIMSRDRLSSLAHEALAECVERAFAERGDASTDQERPDHDDDIDRYLEDLRDRWDERETYELSGETHCEKCGERIIDLETYESVAAEMTASL